MLGFASLYPTYETAYSLSLDVRYHLMTKSVVVPYLGVEGGAAFLDMDNDGATGYQYGGAAGLKFFCMQNANFFAEDKYLAQVFEMDGEAEDTSSPMVNFGLSILF